MSGLTNEQLLKSWERSKKHGADLLKAKEAILPSSEFKQYREQSEELLNSIYPKIEYLAHSLKSSNSVVVISDSSGVLLESIGDPKFLHDTEKIHLQNGACWSEQVRGTNSAGTISVEKKALAVVGKEHYLPSHHMLYCVGSPLFDPHGELLAVLNISGYASLYRPYMLGMVDVIAQNIENWFLVCQPKQQIVISLSPADQPAKYEALLAVDQHGAIIGANREARRLFQVDNISFSQVYLEDLLSNTHQLFRNTSCHFLQLQTKTKEKYNVIASVLMNSFPPKVLFSEQPTKQLPTSRTKKQSCTHYTFQDIYGEDETLQAALHTAKRAALTNYTIMITGESGTGKEMVSQAIHHASSRSTKPFVAINCGGITKSLMESELFGYEAGAFTGAKQTGQPGIFEQADGGTLFLDEIAELPMEIQIALLRVLQDFQITRIGSTKPIQVDVRIITATHTDLWKKVQEGSFRADLFYRLQGVNVKLPPFRERTDRLQLANILLKTIAQELHTHKLTFSPSAENVIKNYSWPGNIRQVKAAIREAAFLSTDGVVDIDNFPSYILESFQKEEDSGSLLKEAENKAIAEAMTRAGGNITKAARILGIGRNTLYRKLDKHSIKNA